MRYEEFKYFAIYDLMKLFETFDQSVFLDCGIALFPLEQDSPNVITKHDVEGDAG